MKAQYKNTCVALGRYREKEKAKISKSDENPKPREGTT